MSMSTRTAIAAAAITVVFAAPACNGKSAKDQVANGAGGPEMTLTGCLEQSDQEQNYVLRAAEGGPRPGATYRVTSPGQVNLAEHVGSRVRITGNIVTVPVNTADDRRAGAEATGTSGDLKSGANTKPQEQRTDLLNMDVLRASAIEKTVGKCETSR
jgi:hypothetical protein